MHCCGWNVRAFISVIYLKNVTLKQKNPAIIKMYLRFQDEKVVFVLIRGDVVIDVQAHNCINTLTQP